MYLSTRPNSRSPIYSISQITGSTRLLIPIPRRCRLSLKTARLAVRASEEKVSTDEASSSEDYQLRHDMKSVARSMLEGKPMLSTERQEVEEQEAKERFVGRLMVLVLGVSFHAAYSI